MNVSDEWGLSRGDTFSEALLNKTKDKLTRLSKFDTQFSDLALDYLMRGLLHPDQRVRKSAVYAAVSKPILLLQVQDRLLEEISKRTVTAFHSAADLIEITGQSFLDKLAIRLTVVGMPASSTPIGVLKVTCGSDLANL